MTRRDADIRQGGIHWFDFGAPRGSEPGGHRPVLVIQGDAFNQSTWRTTVVAAISTNTGLMRLHGMVFLPREDSGLPRDSVVSLTHLVTVNKVELGPAVGEVSTEAWRRVRDAFDEMLGSRRGQQ